MSGGQILMKPCPGGCGGRIPTAWSEKQCVKCMMLAKGVSPRKLAGRIR